VTESALKVVILMAGYGTRLRPHTWSRPKQLIRMAGKRVIDHVLDTFSTLPDLAKVEFIFIIGYLGDQTEAYMQRVHPELKVHFVKQTEMRGQSHAVSMARQYLDGPLIVTYADTLIATDFSFLSQEAAGAVAWVKAVPDPRRFGVANLGTDNWVTSLVEKPQSLDNNLALVGCYYFRSPQDLLQAIQEQMQRGVTLKNEFYLADAINIMLEHGLKMRIQLVDTWLDAGTSDDLLTTNRYLLEHGQDNSTDAYHPLSSVILPPVFIDRSARVENSVIGPHAAIGANCSIQNSIIRDSIIDDGSMVEDVIMEHSLIAQDVRILGQAGSFNLGDQTVLNLK
jgi:glucose-1-phosphate thymidylyltransferase